MRYGLLIDDTSVAQDIARGHKRNDNGTTSPQAESGEMVDSRSYFSCRGSEMIYAHYMKRVIVEDLPTIPDLTSDISRLTSGLHNVNHEAWLLKGIRRHMAAILRSIDADDFERVGMHAADGPLTLADLLQRVTDHIPHHVQSIRRKGSP